MFFWRKKKVEPPLSIWISVNINNYVGLCESLAPTEVHDLLTRYYKTYEGFADRLGAIIVPSSLPDEICMAWHPPKNEKVDIIKFHKLCLTHRKMMIELARPLTYIDGVYIPTRLVATCGPVTCKDDKAFEPYWTELSQIANELDRRKYSITFSSRLVEFMKETLGFDLMGESSSKGEASHGDGFFVKYGYAKL